MKKLRITAIFICLLWVLNLTGCGFAGTTYKDYVQAVLDASYHNEYDAYHDMTISTIPEASDLFRNESSALSERMRNYYGVKSDMISQDTIELYDKLAVEILKKTKYTVRDVIKTENAYQVTLIISPIDFWEKSEPEIKAYYENEFTPKYKQAPTQEKANQLEEVYAKQVYNILNQRMKNLDYLTPVEYSFTIGTGEYTVTGEIWQEIDKLLLNY
ncbi:MAG: hypothetical protein K2G88_03155 [Oscillospiraceae bacterium]|nr:hypothetical protein [Oscillospiraceae bacterium]MDE6657809.1 hypothetical protein [Oscillospiraceae bacterium]